MIYREENIKKCLGKHLRLYADSIPLNQNEFNFPATYHLEFGLIAATSELPNLLSSVNVSSSLICLQFSAIVLVILLSSSSSSWQKVGCVFRPRTKFES